MANSEDRKKRVNITLEEKHLEVVDKEALNLSKFVRMRIEQKYPEYFNE